MAGFDLRTAQPVATGGGFDLSTATPVVPPGSPKGGNTIAAPGASPEPQSAFMKGIKDLGNEAVRVGAKAITGLPLMSGDFFTGVGNAASKLTGGAGDNPYPSDLYNKQLDSAFPAPQGAAGKISEGASTFLASLGLPGPAVPSAAKAALTGGDAVKASTLRAAQAQGLVVPPNNTTSAPLLARIANGWGGKVETNALATARNQPAINSLAATDIGLPPTASLTSKAIAGDIATNRPGVIGDAVKDGYAPLKALGTIPTDAKHQAFAEALGGTDRAASRIDPTLGNPQIAALGKAIDKPSFQSADMVDAIAALRDKAVDAGSAGNITLARAYKQAAGSFESLMDRHLQSLDDAPSNLLDNFRNSRVTIAKAHDILDNLNKGSGNVDGRGIGSLLDKGALSGNLDTIGKFGRAFPDVAGQSKGDPSPITAFQANTIGADGPMATIMNLLGRPAARNYALSDRVQQQLMRAQQAPSLSQAAANAVHGNPAAFGALYGDTTSQ